MNGPAGYRRLSRADLIAYLELHRSELMALRSLLPDGAAGRRDHAALAHRLACVDALLKREGVQQPQTAN